MSDLGRPARPSARSRPLTGRLALLAASMRAAGARVGIDELIAAHRALAAVDPADRGAAYFALRATLCSRRDDLAAFDAAFAELFAPRRSRRRSCRRSSSAAALVLPRVAVPAQEVAVPAEGEAEVVPSAWSDAELLREKDFADYTDAERRLARRVMRRLAGAGPTRPSRRTRRRAARGAPAARRAARPAPDDPLLAAHRRRPGRAPLARARERPRPLVLVCDVSGSMEPYARMLLQYMQACVAARRRVEAFVFGTRLTRVTAELRAATPTARSTAPPAPPTTGRAARASARRSPRSTASTAAGSAAGRSSCCSRTAGTAATPSSSPPRWRASAAARTASSGSTR